MEVDDEERKEIDHAFEQLSQSQSSQRLNLSSNTGPPPIPQSNVGNRRNRRVAAATQGEKIVAEPGFGEAPVNISKKKRQLLDGLKTALSKKECFNNTILDNLSDVAGYLELSETGELIMYSSKVYALRVDTTYNDAVAANVQLQPAYANADDKNDKKSKAEKKIQQSTATQSLNLQRLEMEMNADESEKDRTNNSTPDIFTQKDKENGEGGSDDEDGEGRGVEMTEEQKEKARDAKPIDTSEVTFSNTVISDLVSAEYNRRKRNLDRKCHMNPMLMDDEKKFRMAPTSILTNEYYQIATSRYKDLNASGMLSYNAKVTHDGRMTLMHKRMDAWKDTDANDYAPPTREFRNALSGLVDNAMRAKPQRINDYLFDPKDIPERMRKLTSGKELANLERMTREKILAQTDDFDLLDKDDQVIEDDDEDDTPVPSPKTTRDGGEGQGESSQSVVSFPDSVSLNPSTSAAETENSETSARTTPKAVKDKEHETMKDDLGVLSQADKAEILDASNVLSRKRSKRKAATLAAVFCDDEIKNGPVMAVDTSQFHQILFDKVSMGSKVEWQQGASAEELKSDAKTINAESFFVTRSFDMDLMHLDKVWSSKYYKRTFSDKEVRAIKEKMKNVFDEGSESYKKMSLYLKPGEYEFLGQEDNWTNPEVPADEMTVENEPLVRELHDEKEEKVMDKILAKAAGMNDEEDEGTPIDDDERIHIDPEVPVEFEHHQNDDDNDFGTGMSDFDDEPTSASSKPTDFTVGDDQRFGENPDVNGMLDPLFVGDALPSAAVRTTGKADDSHWKGGDPENAPVKKEKKKKIKEEEEINMRSYFEITENMNDRSKIRRFKQCQSNIDLMKETDQLLMPVQVNVVPQLDYDCNNFYNSFFMPNVRHTQYQTRSAAGDPNEDEDGRLDHYAQMMTSLNGGKDGEDVYLNFMKNFQYYDDVSTQKEIEMEEGVRTGEMVEDEAVADMNGQENDDMGAMGGFDDDDFGGGGGDDEGGRDGVLPPGEDPSARDSMARSIAASGYGVRVSSSDGGDDDDDAVARVGDREYHLRLIKLDTVAMKTALSDVLTNPMMVADKLDETLGHFNRAIPSQLTVGRKRKAKTPMQAINEDEELELSLRDTNLDTTGESQEQSEVNFEATMMEVPDGLNVTRALFAPPKEKAKSNKTIMFGKEMNSSQSRHNSSQDSHIELNGRHTLKSAFTCLPARMPLRATSDVTVASTIAMILHLANENNLILHQVGQDGIDADGNKTAAVGNWMNDFEVNCLDDADGSRRANGSHRHSNAGEVLQQLSADEDATDAEKRQRETDKMLAELAAKQRAEAEEKAKKSRSANGLKRGADPSRLIDDDSEDELLEVEIVEERKPAFKVPAAPHRLEAAGRRVPPRKSGDNMSDEGPSTKRTRRSLDAANTTVQLDDTIVLD